MAMTKGTGSSLPGKHDHSEELSSKGWRFDERPRGAEDGNWQGITEGGQGLSFWELIQRGEAQAWMS